MEPVPHPSIPLSVACPLPAGPPAPGQLHQSWPDVPAVWLTRPTEVALLRRFGSNSRATGLDSLRVKKEDTEGRGRVGKGDTWPLQPPLPASLQPKTQAEAEA